MIHTFSDIKHMLSRLIVLSLIDVTWYPDNPKNVCLSSFFNIHFRISTLYLTPWSTYVDIFYPICSFDLLCMPLDSFMR